MSPLSCWVTLSIGAFRFLTWRSDSSLRKSYAVVGQIDLWKKRSTRLRQDSQKIISRIVQPGAGKAWMDKPDFVIRI